SDLLNCSKRFGVVRICSPALSKIRQRAEQRRGYCPGHIALISFGLRVAAKIVNIADLRRSKTLRAGLPIPATLDRQRELSFRHTILIKVTVVCQLNADFRCSEQSIDVRRSAFQHAGKLFLSSFELLR